MGGVEKLIGEVQGFQKSQVIMTGAHLDIFTRVHEKSCTAAELSAAMELDPRALTVLLDALVALELLDKTGVQYRATEAGRLLSSYHPETMRPLVLHMKHLWNGWGHLSEIVKTGHPWEDRSPLMDQEGREAFIGAMHVAGKSLALRIADAYDLSRFKNLLDIGGGSGTYTVAFLAKNPRMKAIIFDLTGVIPMARKRIEREDLSHRVELVPGDFYQDELPGGCDLALLSAIIHQSSKEQNVGLYAKIHRALQPGGVVLIRDHIMDPSRTRPVEGTLFALNMLVNTRDGGTYTFNEVKEGLEKAGFTHVDLIRQGDHMDCLVEARKPST
jgi:SAM-dependent methyltransferase